MKFILSPTAQLLLLGAHYALARELLNQRQDDGDGEYITSVCSPTTAPNPSDPAPCVAIQNVETACPPNGTSPLVLEAHAQCLCGGNYCAEWPECRRCLLAHGALSQRTFTYFSNVLSAASKKLCTGTPTAAFATLFTDAQAGVPEPTASGTAPDDVESGDAATSLYYTASGPQGPGTITGSATAATKTASDTEKSSSVAETSGPSQSAGAKSTTGAPSTTSSSLSNIAAPTGATGGGRGRSSPRQSAER